MLASAKLGYDLRDESKGYDVICTILTLSYPRHSGTHKSFKLLLLPSDIEPTLSFSVYSFTFFLGLPKRKVGLSCYFSALPLVKSLIIVDNHVIIAMIKVFSLVRRIFAGVKPISFRSIFFLSLQLRLVAFHSWPVSRYKIIEACKK